MVPSTYASRRTPRSPTRRTGLGGHTSVSVWRGTRRPLIGRPEGSSIRARLRELPEHLGHRPDVRLHRPTARSDVADARLRSHPREARHLLPRQLHRIELVREARRRGEVREPRRWSGRQPAAPPRTRRPLRSSQRDRQLLLGAVQAVHAHDVGAGVARASGRTPPAYRPRTTARYRLLEGHRHHHGQAGRLRALDEQQRLAQVTEGLADPEVGRPRVELVLQLPVEQRADVIGARRVLGSGKPR